MHIDFSLSPVKDALGHVVYLIPEGHDITDIKHAETLLEQRVAERTDELEKSKQALAGSEERLRGILDTAAESIITIDQDGVIESFNQAAEQMFGYQKEEVIGQKVEILMPSPYSEEHQSYLNRYRNTHKARIIGIGREVIAKRKDGSIFPIHLAVSEVKHLGVYTGIIRDLTDQKQQEEAIARSEKRYRSLFEESALCLVEEDWSEVKVRLEELRDANITDLERFFEEHPEEALSCLRLREVKEVNKAALRLFGARNKEDLLSSFSGHIDADTWEDPVSLVVALLAGENEYTAEVSIEKLSGDTIPVLFHVAVAAGHENTLKRVVGTVIDISERKHAEELQRTLMAELDHRVKNILATVLSVAQQTIRRSKGLEQFKESFTGRLSALANVHRLLTAQKWQGVLLCDLVESATRPYTEESGPRVNIDGDTVLLSSKGAQAFYMILHELTTNATKYGALSIPCLLYTSDAADEE